MGVAPLSVQDGGLSPSIQAESIHNEKEHQTISITIRCQITPYKTPYMDLNCQCLQSRLLTYMAADDIMYASRCAVIEKFVLLQHTKC